MKILPAITITILLLFSGTTFAADSTPKNPGSLSAAINHMLKNKSCDGIDTMKLAAPQDTARRGCCSHHQGVCGCSGGRQVCCDGTLSPSCTCFQSDPPKPGA